MDTVRNTSDALDDNVMRLVKRHYAAVQPRDEFLGETLEQMYAWQEELTAKKAVAQAGTRGGRARHARLSWLLRLSAAASLVAVVGSFAYHEYRKRRLPEYRVAQVEEHRPKVAILRTSGDVTTGEGVWLLAGDTIRTDATGLISFRYPNEETRVRITGETEVRLGRADAGKRLGVRIGAIEVAAQRQPEERPLVVTTPHAEMRVKGTRFRVDVTDTSTRLEVDDGNVDMRPAESDTFRTVDAGQCAAADREGDLVTGATRPENAIVLFDGADTSEWMRHDGPRIPTAAELLDPPPCHFPVIDDALEVAAGGHLVTKRMFRDFRLYAEFRVPLREEVDSGIWFQFRYGIQIRNAATARTPSGLGWLIYKEPDADASKPDGTWQSLDITYRAARFDENGNKTENARLTAFLNGVKIHDGVEIVPSMTNLDEPDGPSPGPIVLDAFDKRSYGVRFRNIWVVPQ